MVVGGVSSCGDVEGGRGGEDEEAEGTKPADIFSVERKQEKSPKEETSWIKGAGPWALNHER
jgi:hypothetical protein